MNLHQTLVHQKLIEDFAETSFSGSMLAMGKISGTTLFHGDKKLAPDLHVLYFNTGTGLVIMQIIADTVQGVAEFAKILADVQQAIDEYSEAYKLGWKFREKTHICQAKRIETVKAYRDYVEVHDLNKD